jgi:hypothetical protein
MQLIKTDGTTEDYSDTSLTGMQEAVGGYIEIIPMKKKGMIMILNEDGKREGLPFNGIATEMVNLYPGDYIVGNVLIANEDEVE